MLLLAAHLGNQALLPILNVRLLIRSAHQLLLHREVAHVLLLQRFNQEPDASLAVLRFDERNKFTLHHLLKIRVLSTRAKHRGHPLERRHFVLSLLLLQLKVWSKHHVSVNEQVMDILQLVALSFPYH